MICSICERHFSNSGSLNIHRVTCERIYPIRNEIIDLYVNKFISIKKISSKFRIGKDIVREILGERIRSLSESIKIAHSKYPFRHSDDSKIKMRESRLRFMKENPSMTAWRKSGMSYIEKIFYDKCLEVGFHEKYSIEREKSVFPYFIDFAFLNEMVAVELDGKQHDNRKDKDGDKDRVLNSLGWIVFRIKESQIREDIYGCLSDLESILCNRPKIGSYNCGIREYQKSNSKCECGKIISKKSKKCFKCLSIENRKVVRPSYKDLLDKISDLGYRGSGKLYGVSDSSIRKWKKMYEKYR